ncbi:transposase [Streptomyces sp. NPDC102467]|uniref:transposase n=1 Tax=Streptomyces sp. NPDC102467 TaxID=3366179 RepID=UPI003813B27D
MSFDGCSSQKVPDTERNRAWPGRTSHHGCPTLELMTPVETGTRALIGALFGPTAEGETSFAARLLHLLRPDMLVLWDKGFDSNSFLAAVNATGAQVLGRLRANRRTPVLTRLGDGSYLSVIDTGKVRVIDATIMVTCADGTVFTSSYRLVTTLTDARRYPAPLLAGLYHQRWEHETAYYALRHTIMNGRVLRSGGPAGVELEPAQSHPQLPAVSRDDRHTALAGRRRHRILALLEKDPDRLWRPRDIASHIGDITMETMYRQLSRWAETGLIHKLGPGLYAATAWTPTLPA